MRAATASTKSRSLLDSYTANLGQLVSSRKSQRALRAAAAESAMASRAKSEFLANMSHELRTPLNAIIGFGELVETIAPSSFAAGKHREYATHIATAGRHLLQIISDILDISQIESGAVNLAVQAHSPKKIIDSCIVLVKGRIEKKEQRLIVEVPDTLPAIAADELRLKQILINLIANASKFTDEGGHIKVGAWVNKDDTITLCVADSGRGMTEEEIVYAMKPFTQVTSSYSRDHEGTGLGLPITKALTLRQGGEFDITSTPGVGTEVMITLPQACVLLSDENSAAEDSGDWQ
jgi:two-component system cell cycle sensor histidine kinase PleC